MNESQIDFLARMFFNDLKILKKPNDENSPLDPMRQDQLLEVIAADIDRLIIFYRQKTGGMIEIKEEEKEHHALKILHQLNMLISKEVLIW